MHHVMEVSRRSMLLGTVAVAGLVATRASIAAEDAKPLPDYVSWKDPNAMIVHSNNTLETKREAFGTSAVTPENKLYIRNNIAPPPASILDDRDGWSVEFEGVANPGSLTVAELKNLGVQTVAMVLQCSGNGRAYFEHKPSGTSWQVGAAGNVIWTGVPLRAVVDSMGGVAAGAKYVTGTGGEIIPEGLNALDVMVERSVPIDVLDTIILAWEINGEPISLAHGGPIRMIVPGFTGVNNVKYLKKLALTEEQSPAKIQQTRYRIYPIGGQATPDDPSVWQMNVKSWITEPLVDRASGMAQISGVAFGGVNAVTSVEVSVDGGKNWEKAEFIGPDLGKYAWRVFNLSKQLAPGKYTLVSRATDTEGNVQPEEFEPNAPGYSHNGWRAPGVEITVS